MLFTSGFQQSQLHSSKNKQMKHNLQLGVFFFQERFNETIPHSQLELLWPLTTASFSLGGAFGTFLVKPMLSRFGELRSMFFVQVKQLKLFGLLL